MWLRNVLPSMSATEREALEAGDVWWDADLFTGTPRWEKLLNTPPAQLSNAERAFLDGPVEELCHMLDDWRIQWEWRDLPPEVWAFLKRSRFFGMIIPQAYGGLGFSAYAHSEVIRKISTRSLTGAVTVMVPNSLGPGELLVQFGTEEQKAPMMSLSFMIRRSSPSMRTSVPDHFPNRTRSPVLTSSGLSFPFSSRAPGPTAITSPSCGFSFAVSGMMMPPLVFSSASIRRTTTRSCKGRNC